ncbi:Rieske 2Fe-2S domain-containing protein [Paenibacillus sp. IB182496]|uniref:Rieske 2Fe-2S domain-containing protein n=1 Tax=Paenibacillus sabuli TaxID=2772509 RepID=A0A927BTB5_9BACL|nr:Rieske 2Fe-2S domain-containing protein [Paenibacillus sabuli]MBD2845048.1 Rieske 2Fe-2S domain-containing protein [Paenibacillus sabuli]
MTAGRTWIAAAELEDLRQGVAKLVVIGGIELGLFRESERVYAVRNLCPHALAPICAGKVEGVLVADADGAYDYQAERRVLRCPWHHWEFELDGGRAVCNIRQRIQTFETKIADGKVWVWIKP